MEIGIKIFPEDLAYAKKIVRYADFIEVTAIPGSNFRALKCLKKPFTIHTIHSRWGFNSADPEKKLTINRKGIETAKKAADILDADTIIIHPGYIEDRDCSLKQAISVIRPLDRRFIVENMPKYTKGRLHVGASLQQIKRIRQGTGKGMCLDFPHAAEYAHQSGIYYIDFIKKLLELKPRYYHISDTRIQNKKDLHLHLKDGNLRIKYLESIIPEPDRSRLLIETSHDFMKQHRDITLLRKNL
ncbi:sugar phosphate isomerase/epimerase, partial [Candidatus Woesearchaeota archaeon]|nr:sugar phosphate isomerase/epimerase [Candidatus Woesearchaeota archaeon]